jgi:hypothetical protein
MSVIGTHQILPGEPGYVDYSKPAAVEPPRTIARPATPAEDQATLLGIAGVIEALLKELKRKPTPERISQIDVLLKAKTPALLSELVRRRRLATGLDRLHSDGSVTVQEARRRYLGIGFAADHDELVTLVGEALELFKTECQNAPVS